MSLWSLGLSIPRPVLFTVTLNVGAAWGSAAALPTGMGIRGGGAGTTDLVPWSALSLASFVAPLNRSIIFLMAISAGFVSALMVAV